MSQSDSVLVAAQKRLEDFKTPLSEAELDQISVDVERWLLDNPVDRGNLNAIRAYGNRATTLRALITQRRSEFVSDPAGVLDYELTEFDVDQQTWPIDRLDRLQKLLQKAGDSQNYPLYRYKVEFAIREYVNNQDDRRSFQNFLEFKQEIFDANPTGINIDKFASMEREYKHYLQQFSLSDLYGDKDASDKFATLRQAMRVGSVTPTSRRAAVANSFSVLLVALRRPNGLTLTQAEGLLAQVQEQSKQVPDAAAAYKDKITEFTSIVTGRRILVKTALDNAADLDEVGMDLTQLDNYYNQLTRALEAENDHKSTTYKKLVKLRAIVSFQMDSINSEISPRVTYQRSKDLAAQGLEVLQNPTRGYTVGELEPLIRELKRLDRVLNNSHLIEQLEVELDAVRQRDEQEARSTFGHDNPIPAAAVQPSAPSPSLAASRPSETKQTSYEAATEIYNSKMTQLQNIHKDLSLATEKAVNNIKEGLLDAAAILDPPFQGSGLTPTERAEREILYSGYSVSYTRALNQLDSGNPGEFSGNANNVRHFGKLIAALEGEEKGPDFINSVNEYIHRAHESKRFIAAATPFQLELARLGDDAPIIQGIKLAIDAWNAENPNEQNVRRMHQLIYITLLARASSGQDDAIPGAVELLTRAIKSESINAGNTPSKADKDIQTGTIPSPFVAPTPPGSVPASTSSLATRRKASRQTERKKAQKAAEVRPVPTPLRGSRSDEYKAEEYSHLWRHIQDALKLISTNFNDPANQTPKVLNGGLARLMLAASTSPDPLTFPVGAFKVVDIPLTGLILSTNDFKTPADPTPESITETIQLLSKSDFNLSKQSKPEDNDRRSGYLKLIVSINIASTLAEQLLELPTAALINRKKKRHRRVYKAFFGPILHNSGLAKKFKESLAVDEDAKNDTQESVEAALAIARYGINRAYSGLVPKKDITVASKIQTTSTAKNKAQAAEAKRASVTLPGKLKQLQDAKEAKNTGEIGKITRTITSLEKASAKSIVRIAELEQQLADLEKENKDYVVGTPVEHRSIDQLGPQVMILLGLLRGMPVSIFELRGEQGGDYQSRLYTRLVWTFANIVFWGLYEEMSHYKTLSANEEPWVFGAWVALDLLRRKWRFPLSTNYFFNYQDDLKVPMQKSGFRVLPEEAGPHTDKILLKRLLDELFFDYLNKRLPNVQKHTDASAAIPGKIETLSTLLQDQIRLDDLFQAKPTVNTERKAKPATPARRDAPTPSGTPLKGPKPTGLDSARKRREDMGEVKNVAIRDAEIAAGKAKYGNKILPKSGLPLAFAQFERADRLWFLLRSRPQIGGDTDVPGMEYVFTRASDRKWLYDPVGSFDSRTKKATENYPKYILNRCMHVYLQSLWLRYIMTRLEKPASAEVKRSEARSAIAFTPAPVLALNTSPPAPVPEPVQDVDTQPVSADIELPPVAAISDVPDPALRPVSSPPSQSAFTIPLLGDDDDDDSILGRAPPSVIGDLGSSQTDQPFHFTPNPTTPLSPLNSLTDYLPPFPKSPVSAPAPVQPINALDTSTLNDFGLGDYDDDDTKAAAPIPSPRSVIAANEKARDAKDKADQEADLQRMQARRLRSDEDIKALEQARAAARKLAAEQEADALTAAGYESIRLREERQLAQEAAASAVFLQHQIAEQHQKALQEQLKLIRSLRAIRAKRANKKP